MNAIANPNAAMAKHGHAEAAAAGMAFVVSMPLFVCALFHSRDLKMPQVFSFALAGGVIALLAIYFGTKVFQLK